MENEQIALLPSGKTTEEVRVEGELLTLPDDKTIAECVQEIDGYGSKLCKAATANGLSFGEEKIRKDG